MKYRILAASFLTLALSFSLLAQTRGSGGKPSVPSAGNNGTTGRPTNNPDTPSLRNPTSFFLVGKVRIEDGTVLTDEPAIQSECKARTRTEGYTDSKGNFSFEISNLRENELSGLAQASDSAGFGRGENNGTLQERWRNCQLQAVLPGFTSDVIEVGPHLLGMGNADVGTIVLHRQSQVEGLTISATTAAAPAKARNNYEKGRELAKKQKWEQATEKFRKAVELYPKYAVAWVELGRVQAQNKDAAAARQSFRQAVAADPKFLNPYRELAKLAFRDQQWQEVVDTTAEALKLNPVSFPQDWLLNASA
ncbi:MAG TPA: tetratricopeptide repeat protein, partial [Terriglobales bacterium]|nr:tetratricopeptide repeat protein [Terriglobales bacterium]